MNKSIKNKRIIFFTFLIIVFAGISIISFHYHENGKIPKDCPICAFQIFGNNLIDETIINAVISQPQISVIIPFLKSGLPENIIISAVYIHAPPAFS